MEKAELGCLTLGRLRVYMCTEGQTAALLKKVKLRSRNRVECKNTSNISSGPKTAGNQQREESERKDSKEHRT